MTTRTDSVTAMKSLRSVLEIQNKTTPDDTDFCNNENIEDAVSTLSENHVKRLKENLDKKDHALCEVQERERRLKVQTERLSRDLKREKDETVKLRKQLQSKDIQHTHELRRIQQSGQKLRVQLEKTAGSYMPKDKASQKLQTETDKKLRVYEQTIQRLEDNNGLMLEEINELRETLALHTNGIELQVEASGVWDDTKT
ncbi:afadin- and alpha-actinin-binding protein-like isoform X2 [Venturia canescens]|uniref:afadin- and alpha-actinin-binding protein-like isoform X2 n=1 Tax=Venturia canescens TaxID=32260 RepID=UPI001C9CDE63|nr:afadin- and alpha-actinin-binding protein-like isoform X2 [Venturia canescens]